jgi:hypothetical protein
MIRFASIAVIVGMAGHALPARGQAMPSSWFSDTVTVIAGKRYAKGGVYRFFFGDHYRDLWTTPIRVPVLDLAKFAGGLKPKREGGGQQTKSIRLAGADGKEYQFRSVDKDPSAVLPLGLRETFADRVFQDQISAGHPAGPLVVPPILAAAGVLHSTPIMVVMPDDPALGSFRGKFAGLLGTIEERPKDASDEDVSFAGAKDIVGTDDLFKRIDKHPLVRVDSKEFLVARLTDVYLGDWDRHRDQWRWALLEDQGGEHWQPIPRDRDQAFVEFDGLLLTLVRGRVKQLVKFNRDYPPIEGATWNGRDLDHRLLTDLTRAEFDSIAKALQSRITDDVIERAVAQLPPEYQPLNADFLRRGLRSRRDRLVIIAGRYYRMLAGQVDVYGSGQADLATIVHTGDGLDVTLSLRDKPDRPYYRRHFVSGETSDVRVYLQGGADSAIVSGEGGIKVRVIGGPGNDAFAKTSGGPAHFYDSEGENRSSGERIRTKPYQAIDDTTDKSALPHRDWGRNTLVYPIVSYGSDPGFQLGLGSRIYHWGFRKKPYSSEVHYTVRVASGSGLGKITFDARFANENSRNYWEIAGQASGVESLRWYGFGNESVSDPAQPTAFYRTAEKDIRIAPSVGWLLGDRVRLTFGPRFKYAVTNVDEGPNVGRFIGSDRPFGTGTFAQIGAGVDLLVDTRDVPTAPRHGVTVDAGAKYVPSVLDVKKSFGEVHGRATTYLSAGIPTRPVLALQVGGQHVFGTKGQIPWHEAAFLGSSYTLRGFQNNRFAGDASVYGSAELRLHLSSLFLFVPGSQGIFGFVDGGRVYYEGEQSSTWHHTFGGGIWAAFLTPGSLLSLAVGKSDDGTRIYLRAGFAY